MQVAGQTKLGPAPRNRDFDDPKQLRLANIGAALTTCRPRNTDINC